jgi:hypothetical protein
MPKENEFDYNGLKLEGKSANREASERNRYGERISTVRSAPGPPAIRAKPRESCRLQRSVHEGRKVVGMAIGAGEGIPTLDPNPAKVAVTP